MMSTQKLRGRSGELSLRGRSRLVASLALIICLLAMPLGAWGADITWDNGAGTGVYNTAGNWVGGTAPGVGDNALFSPAGSTLTFTGAASSLGWVISNAGYTYTVTQVVTFAAGGTGITGTAAAMNIGAGGSMIFNAGDAGASTYTTSTATGRLIFTQKRRVIL